MHGKHTALLIGLFPHVMGKMRNTHSETQDQQREENDRFKVREGESNRGVTGFTVN